MQLRFTQSADLRGFTLSAYLNGKWVELGGTFGEWRQWDVRLADLIAGQQAFENGHPSTLPDSQLK